MTTQADSSTTTLPEPTDARFSMRALLIAMAGVAALAALVGPIVRRLDPTAQIRLLVAWALWLAMAIAWIGILAHRRARVEKLAGQTLLRLPMFDEGVSTASPLRRKLNVVAALFLCVIMLFPISQFVVIAPRNQLSFAEITSFLFMSVFSFGWLGRAVAVLWWRSSVRFCEGGILWDQKLLRWDHVLERRWNEYDAGVLMVRGIDQRGAEASWRIPISPAELATVQSLVDARASQPSIPPGLSMTDLSTIPLSIAVRDAEFFKVLGKLLAGLAIAIGYFVLRNRFPVSEWFGRTALLGIIGLAIVTASFPLGVKHSGVPIVRLNARRRWLALIGYAPGAAALYYLGYAYGWMSPWRDYSLGASFGVFAAMALGNAFPTQIDLRDIGVVRLGLRRHWPWPEIRLLTWDSDVTGRLVLSRGWRRIVATVPQEQREAVDRVMKEKLGHVAG